MFFWALDSMVEDAYFIYLDMAHKEFFLQPDADRTWANCYITACSVHKDGNHSVKGRRGHQITSRPGL